MMLNSLILYVRQVGWYWLWLMGALVNGFALISQPLSWWTLVHAYGVVFAMWLISRPNPWEPKVSSVRSPRA